MPVTLARRIRRIGILPQRKIEDVMDAQMLLKIKNRTATMAERELHVALLKELSDAPRHMEISPEVLDAETKKLRAEYKARRVQSEKSRPSPKSKYRRSKSRRKAEKKAA